MTWMECGSESGIKRGKTRNGKQQFGCKTCGVTFRESPQTNAYNEARTAEMLRAYHECSSSCGLTHTFEVSGQTVTSWLKTVREFSLLHATLLPYEMRSRVTSM